MANSASADSERAKSNHVTTNTDVHSWDRLHATSGRPSRARDTAAAAAMQTTARGPGHTYGPSLIIAVRLDLIASLGPVDCWLYDDLAATTSPGV